jgi:hypothetical protein
MNLPIELITRINDHIGNVQQHLGELPPDEQREILQALETHIHDALEARSNGNQDIQVLEAIIAEMDPPESYGSAPLIAPPNSTTLSSGRKILFFSAIATLCLLFIAIWLADPFSSHWMDEPQAEAQVQLIHEGAGLNGFTIGVTGEALVQQHGAAQSNHPDWLMRWDENPFVDIIISDEGVCREVRFNQGFKGETAAGIKLGSSFEEAHQAYGAPEQVWTQNSCVIAEWPSKGISLWTSDARVTQLIVRSPRKQSRPPFKDDPSIIGHWESIDFVQHIDQFTPATPYWKGDDLFLKELTFLPDGASPNHCKWTKGFVLYENTMSRYELKNIGDETYLFLEWMSGDVTIRGASPRYYVLSKK